MLLRLRHSEFFRRSQARIIETPEGVRLSGELSTHDDNAKRSLLILFHGWEGSSRSAYVLSAASFAYHNGYNVFCLNFRDHNNTHHLNKGLFNSSLIDEVISAVSQIQQLIPHERCHLAGFSLGANFALRVGIHAHLLPMPLHSLAAVCPVFRPDKSTRAVEESLFIYSFYFTQKWKQSLRKKLAIFPEYNYGKELDKLRSLSELNNFFIPRYTSFDSVDAYFESYTLTAEKLAKITLPTLVIACHDDPVIPIRDIQHVEQQLPNSSLEFDLQQRGSHCALVEKLSRASWADRRLLSFMERHADTRTRD